MYTSVPLFVNGEGMRGGAVHHTIDADPFLGHVRAAPKYRLFSVGDRIPRCGWSTRGASAFPASCTTSR